MGERSRGEKIFDEKGLTPELLLTLKIVAAKLAGRRFTSVGKLASGMVETIWNPWNIEGGVPYVKAAVKRTLQSPQLLEQLGVARVERSNFRDRFFRRPTTALYLADPKPAGKALQAETPTGEMPAVKPKYEPPKN